ncbi:MAG: DMT family transporter [Sphingomonadales bacterium]|jgi:drug/metabolite transporter (DMT)-like permease
MSKIGIKRHSLTGPDVIRANLICLIAVALFAFTFPASDILLNDWGILSVIVFRNISAFVLLLIMWVISEGYSQIKSADWLNGLWVGGVGFGIGSVLMITTIYLTTPVVAALTAAIMPLTGVVLEVLFDGRKLRRWFVVGFVLVLIGGFLATGVNFSEAKFGFGALLGLVGSALYAWGSRATVVHLPKLTPLGQTTVTSFGMTMFGVIFYLVALSLGLPGTMIPEVTNNHIVLILVTGWVSLSISQYLWIKGVGKLGIGIASFHLNGAPFFVMLILLVLGGEWNWQTAIGALVLVLGVMVSQK